jgi:hypothetical protein
MKTAELTGAALDWAVGMAEGYELNLYGVSPSIRARVPGQGVHSPWRPSYYWDQGSSIIEREKITCVRGNDLYFPKGNESGDHYGCLWLASLNGGRRFHGRTYLEAAMRCYVASKLGEEVPEVDEHVIDAAISNVAATDKAIASWIMP